MANKNFEVKHGLSVGGTERISSAGVGTFTDLNVTGTTTTIDTATLQVQDKNIVLNYGTGDTSSSSDGAGITIQDAVDATADATLLWDAGNSEFDFSHTVTAPALTIAGAATFDGSTLAVDATNNKVGIGTTTPSQILNVESTSTPVLEVSTLDDNNPANASAIDLVEKQPTHASATATFGQSGVYGYRIQLNGSDNKLRIKSGSQTTVNDRITLDRDTGNVGIGTTSPDTTLHIKGGGDTYVTLEAGASDGNCGLLFDNSSSTQKGALLYDTDDNYLLFNVNGTEHFRIAAGDVLVKSADLKMEDSRSLYFGAGNDLRIYHDGSDSYIKDQGTGNLVISSSDTYFMNMTSVRFLFNDTTIQVADAGTNAATIKSSSGDELYLGGDNNDGYFRIKDDGNTQVNSPSNFWVHLDGADRYGFDSVRIYPGSNNTYDLGLSSYRWRTVYGVNSNFSSDARLKTTLTSLTNNEIEASKLLAKEIGTYKWLDQVASEGDKAKINIGLTAQKIIEIMESCSLNALDYQLVTFSEWDATEAKTEKRLGEDGKVEEYNIDAIPAGDEYGVCYEQLNQFIAAGFNARLEALEG